MDRMKTIEYYLLARCRKYKDDEDIFSQLENRYSSGGSQKPYLILEGTDLNGSNKKDTSVNEPDSTVALRKKSDNKYNPLKVKNEFKSTIKSKMKEQNQIARKLRMISKRNPKILEQDVINLRICKSLMRYEHYIEMNRLWQSYMTELVKGVSNSMILTAKLSSAEYIGAELTVTHSLCPEQIGLRGIVLWESKDYYLLIIPRKSNWKSKIPNYTPTYTAMECIGGLRKIQKVHTRFSFDVIIADNNVLSFECIGDRMNIRSVDRANKKFKSHSADDLNL